MRRCLKPVFTIAYSRSCPHVFICPRPASRAEQDVTDDARTIMQTCVLYDRCATRTKLTCYAFSDTRSYCTRATCCSRSLLSSRKYSPTPKLSFPSGTNTLASEVFNDDGHHFELVLHLHSTGASPQPGTPNAEDVVSPSFGLLNKT